MLNKFKKILLLIILIHPTTCFADDGVWDYHGSGRDYPYSKYIDRRNYIGHADYSPIEAYDIDESPYFNNVPHPTPLPVQIIQAPLVTLIKRIYLRLIFPITMGVIML